MFCGECGAKINDKAVICVKCGVPVRGMTRPCSASVAGSVDNHMIGAILTTLFCCQIGGVIAIVYASQVNTRLAMGDVEGAEAASRTASNWINASIIIGLIGGVLYFLLVASGVALD